LFCRPPLPVLCSDKLRLYVYFSVRNVSAEVQVFKKKQRKNYLNVLMWARMLEMDCQMHVITYIKYVIKLCTFIFA